MSKSDKATAGKKSRGASMQVADDSPNVPGLTENPATNLLIVDILVRMGSVVMRSAIEKNLLKGRYGKPTAKKIVQKRSVPHRIATAALSRVGTASLPGAALVGAGLVAKTVFERRRASRLAKALGDQKLLGIAEKE